PHIRINRAITSVCVYEKTCPTCNDPDAVGGGVSIENTASRVVSGLNAYTRLSSHRALNFSSSPSKPTRSGTFTVLGVSVPISFSAMATIVSYLQAMLAPDDIASIDISPQLF